MERDEFHRADCKGIIEHCSHVYQWNTTPGGDIGTERITENLLHVTEGLGHHIDRDRSPHLEVIGTQIIEARDMIEVMMGIDYSIEQRNLLPQALLAEIARCIDDYAFIPLSDPDGWAEPLIARIGRKTCPTGTCYRWHSGRSSTPQKRYLHSAP
jgi:hypothetical protein